MCLVDSFGLHPPLCELKKKGNLKGRSYLEDLGVNGRIILKRILTRVGGYRIDSSGE
jgi:hypothetical protein